MPVYLDCAATTPLDPRVRDHVMRVMDEDYGNAGSRTHARGHRARATVEQARARVAAVVGAARGDVIFTSGATEANNLAILGLAVQGESHGRRHLVSTRIEHHAVLEPLAALQQRGFEIDLVAPGPDGRVTAEAIARVVRPDTLLVSVMHVNNETGMTQPIADIADCLAGTHTWLHVDAAQGFGKTAPGVLRDARIDLISISGHKIHAPQGIGALITRSRGGVRPPVAPLLFGGGQERTLRPGTHPVALIAGLGLAADLALVEHEARARQCLVLRQHLLDGLAPLRPVINGDPRHAVPHILSLSVPGIDGEQIIDAWQDLVACARGAACTSQSYTCSHVLGAMGVSEAREDGTIRLSWCHTTPLPDVSAMVQVLEPLRRPLGNRA